jgi:adenosine deaminase
MMRLPVAQTAKEQISDLEDALAGESLDRLRAVPKTDFHNHSVFGTRFDRIQEWVGRPLRRPPSRMHSIEEMQVYSRECLRQHVLSRRGIEFTADSAIRDAIQDGVKVLEMSLDAGCLTMYTEGPDGFFLFVSDLIAKYKDQLDFRPEIGVAKDQDPKSYIPLATQCIRSGVFRSIDLYGPERAQHPAVYEKLYSSARKKGLKLKAHVGEFGDAKLVSDTLDILQLDEIQHGISAASSVKLMRRLRRENVRLNVCPTSNVVLGRVKDLSQHPIRKLFDNGVRVSINSDDIAIFDQSVSDEFMNLYKSGTLSAPELESIRRESLSS